MTERRRGLGKGLGALIPESGASAQRRSPVAPQAPVAPAAPAAPAASSAPPPPPTPARSASPGAKRTATAGAAAAKTTAPPGGRASAEAGTAATARGAAKSAAGPSPAKTAAAKPPRAGGAPDGPDLVEVPGAAFAEIALTEIRPNPVQPRRVFDDDALAELTASVKEVGLLQPIVVRPLDPPQDGHSYELVMGERRWRAVAAAGLDSIPAIVRDTPDSQLLRDALLENLHRANLNPLEEAAAYQQMLDDFGCTQDQLAQQIARSRPQISNTLRLLKLPPLVQRRLAAGVLSAGHARALLGLPDGGAMERLAQRIVAEGLSVRATEEIVALGGVDAERPPARSRRRPVGSPAATALQDRLTDRFDTRVQVALGQRKGKVVIEFASVEDLNRILTTLAPGDPGLAV